MEINAVIFEVIVINHSQTYTHKHTHTYTIGSTTTYTNFVAKDVYERKIFQLPFKEIHVIKKGSHTRTIKCVIIASKLHHGKIYYMSIHYVNIKLTCFTLIILI